MLFQSANGGILVLTSEELPASELPVEQEAGDSETEISASLLSSPILNRGDSGGSELGRGDQNDFLGASYDQILPVANHSYFTKTLIAEQSFRAAANTHFGTIASLGP